MIEGGRFEDRREKKGREGERERPREKDMPYLSSLSIKLTVPKTYGVKTEGPPDRTAKPYERAHRWVTALVKITR